MQSHTGLKGLVLSAAIFGSAFNLLAQDINDPFNPANPLSPISPINQESSRLKPTTSEERITFGQAMPYLVVTAIAGIGLLYMLYTRKT